MAGIQFMKRLLSPMLFLVAGACFGADTYKWVDEKGVTNYGEKPPASRPAQPVNTQPSAVIETGGQFSQKAQAATRRAGEDLQRPQFAAALPSSAMPARGMDFDVYIRLQRGMTEGELLLRAGRPDHESLDSVRPDIGKTYYYFPTSSNPFTTVVTLRGGRIFELDRIKKF
jgi:hypothetical protein